MTKQIDKKIVGYKVSKDEQQVMHEGVERPEVLIGTTYKIKPPQLDHAVYITINDVVLNDKDKHPYEIFINSKNMENFAWVTSLTRVISAVFRKGGDVSFLVDELKGVFDPKGGYFYKGSGFINSIPAHIGLVIDKHLRGKE